MSRASQTAERVKGQLGHMLNAWQDDALRESIAAAQSRGLDVDRAMRSLAATGHRFDLKAVLDALRPPAGSAAEVPYHVPTCRCGGEGWVDGPPARNLGRDYQTIARCPEGGPITPAMWDAWNASAGQWTPPATATDPTTRRAAARRMTAAARAALPARPATEATTWTPHQPSRPAKPPLSSPKRPPANSTTGPTGSGSATTSTAEDPAPADSGNQSTSSEPEPSPEPPTNSATETDRRA